LNAVGCTWFVSISDTTYDFGSWEVGTTATGKTFTISVTNNNASCSSRSGFSVNLTGGDAGQYAVSSNTCPGTIPEEGASCAATVTFSPTTAGTYTDAAFQAGWSTNPYDTVALSGTGTASSTGGDSAAVLLLASLNKNDSDGCNATASTGVAGKGGFGPSALGFFALMGLVMGTVAVRRRIRRE